MENTMKVTELAKAMAKAQSEFGEVPLDSENPFFHSRYASLKSVMETVRPVLAKNGLSIIQTTGFQGERFGLYTTLLHTSGDSLSGFYWINPAKPDPQGLGAAVSYARRYAMAAMLGIVNDTDDDGNATGGTVNRNTQTNVQENGHTNVKTENGNNRKITDKQAKRLYAISKSAGREDVEAQDHLQEQYGFNRTSDVTENVYEEICTFFGTPVKVA